jgi:hypothetical protein
LTIFFPAIAVMSKRDFKSCDDKVLLESWFVPLVAATILSSFIEPAFCYHNSGTLAIISMQPTTK